MVNLTQNQVAETITMGNKIESQCRALPNNNYEQYKTTYQKPATSDPNDMEVTFSVAEGVSGAQDALPETQPEKHDGFTKRELALLKEVDTRAGIKSRQNILL